MLGRPITYIRICIYTYHIQFLFYLTFMGPYITNVFLSITNKMQRYTIYLFLCNARQVSGGSSAHRQELKTVHTASGTLSNHLFHDSGR